MPQLLAFAGLRPDTAITGPLGDVICPPYDIITEEQRVELLGRSPFNVVRVELPNGRYREAAALFEEWKKSGALARETEPALYAYRMSYQAPGGETRHTFGVMGALVLEPPGHGILPHEQTTPKAKGDRLELIRATHANTSPIWCLCTEPGLAAALGGPPDPGSSDPGSSDPGSSDPGSSDPGASGPVPPSPAPRTRRAPSTSCGPSWTGRSRTKWPGSWRPSHYWWPTATTATKRLWPTRPSSGPGCSAGGRAEGELGAEQGRRRCQSRGGQLRGGQLRGGRLQRRTGAGRRALRGAPPGPGHPSLGVGHAGRVRLPGSTG